MTKSKTQSLTTLPVLVELIQRRIYLIRGRKVMLDADLAALYQVETKALTRAAVKRNADRFPDDFMFQLTPEEAESLRSQIGASNLGRGGRRYLPYVFTEQGVAMLSSVLNSSRAIHVNIAIMRAFVQLREILSSTTALSHKLAELERKMTEHDRKFAVVFIELRKLIDTPLPPKKRIGFKVPDK